MSPLKNLPFTFKQIKQNYKAGHSGVKFIIVHDTGNKSKGANAQAHFNYFNGAYRGASADYFVDDKQIIQTVSDRHTSWHCGDNQGHGRALNGAKNSNSIGIEICINSDGKYNLAVANTLELVKNLQKLHNVPSSRVQRHYDVSRKNCPGTMAGNNWAKWKQFKRDLEKPMILKINTAKNSTATTISGNPSSGSTGTPSGTVWYGIDSPHNTKAAVRKLQQDLVFLGHSVGSFGANGVMGNDTQGAIRAFQKANKLTVDGSAGQATLKKIKKAVEDKKKPPKPVGEIWYGMGSPHNTVEGVKKLQQDLTELGHSVGRHGANGVMGDDTRGAIIDFQKKNKMKVDGSAGQATLKRIKQLINEKNKPVDLFRVRKSWKDSKSQKGAFESLEGAIEVAEANKGYNVYDESGKEVYKHKVEAIPVPKPEPKPEPKPPKPVPKPPIVVPKPEIKPEQKVKIDGQSVATASQMAKFLLDNNSKPKITITALELAELFISEGKRENIRGDIAFCQSMKETGWLSYGGQVLPEQNNYAGIGATNNSPVGKGAWFKEEREGVRAQIQHLKAYSNRDSLNSPLVDPRFGLVSRGIAPNWTDLNGKWAVPGKTYGQSILRLHEDLIAVVVEESTTSMELEVLKLEFEKLKGELAAATEKVERIKKIIN